MKHNISNKPKANFTINASRRTLLDFINKTVEWDEGFKEELQQLFSNRPRWIVKENSESVDILRALAELQRWCDRAETEILGENQP